MAAAKFDPCGIHEKNNLLLLDSTFGQSCDPHATAIQKSDGTIECLCPICEAEGYNQVCGDDGVTYGNECEMKARGCTEKKLMSVAKYSPCGKCEYCYNGKVKSFNILNPL